MGITRTGIVAAVVALAVVIGLTLLLGTYWTLGILLAVVILLGLFLLFTAKTSAGRRLGGAMGRRIGRTRIGKRMAHAQLRAEAKRKGISMTDPFGRPLSDIELQLELVDTPETRAIKRQLKGLNPQQRGQALRMLERQAEEAARTGETPNAPQPPRRQGYPGRPVTRPPRSGKRRKQ
jgi:hypothetical protein